MALQTVTVTLTSAATATFTFAKPTGNYGKSAPSIATSGGALLVAVYAPDVDNGNGTMTGTVNLSAAVTGTAEITIYDRV